MEQMHEQDKKALSSSRGRSWNLLNCFCGTQRDLREIEEIVPPEYQEMNTWQENAIKMQNTPESHLQALQKFPQHNGLDDNKSMLLNLADYAITYQLHADKYQENANKARNNIDMQPSEKERILHLLETPYIGIFHEHYKFSSLEHINTCIDDITRDFPERAA